MEHDLDPHTHPGTFIREHVIPSGMSVTNAAKRLGVGRPALSNLLNGKSSLSPSMATKLEKTFGIDRNILLDLQATFDRYRRLEKEKSVAARAYVPSFIEIKAQQIHNWANTHDARKLLPVLLRRLIHSTGHDLRQVDFPGYYNAERKGWDGLVETGAATPWIPVGKSCWEFGVSKNPLRKAENDYSVRTLSTPLTERHECTFIFVTPRNWPGKNEWVKNKCADEDWKEVRVLDASDLEQWIEESIPAQIWFARQLSIPTDGVEPLEQFWQHWAEASDPVMSPLIFQPAITAHRTTIINWLKKPSERPLVVTADSKDEALAFLAHLFRDADISAQSESLAVVFRSAKTLRSLASSSSPFIPIVYSDETERELATIRTRFHCITVRPRNAVDSNPDIVLGSLDHETFKNALTEMGFTEDEIRSFARASGYSPTILRRQLSNIETIRIPQWAGETKVARDLIPIALAGAWHGKSNADREVLRVLADRDYQEIEKAIARLRVFDDCPVWCVRQYRGVVSKIDALFAISNQVIKQDLDDFFELAEYVLSEDDPALELPENTRWAAALYGKERNHSQALRESICETLVILSIHGNHLFRKRLGIDIEVCVSSLINRLMTPLTLDKLLSHNNELPHYAEAAPSTFLDLLEADLNEPQPATLGLLKPTPNGPFGQCTRSGLLWALECLAWKNLHRVSPILARMSRTVIDDNWTNKPIVSLESIYRFWMPQTAAPFEDRLKALEVLAEKFPDIGWRVCISQLDAGRLIGDYSHRPRWRNDATGSGQPISGEEASKFRRKALDLVLTWPKQYGWKEFYDLIERTSMMPDECQKQVWDQVETWAENKEVDDSAKANLREKIHQFAFTYLGQWRDLDEVAKSRIRKIYDNLQSRDSVLQHTWLFTNHLVALPDINSQNGENADLEENERKVLKKRVRAMQAIWVKHGFHGITKLLSNNSIPEIAGRTLARVVKSPEEQSEFLQQCLSISDSLEEMNADFDICMRGFLLSLNEDTCKTLLSAIIKKIDFSSCIRLLKCAPFRKSTWLLLAQLNREAQNKYWREVVPPWGHYDESELIEIVDRLLEAERPRAAFHAVHLHWSKVETSRLKRLLLATASICTEPVDHYKIDPYHISEALNSLDGRTGVSLDEMAQLEFSYISALEHSEHGIPNLERQISESPAMFFQAVALVYSRRDRGQDPANIQVKDPERRTQLALAAHRLLDQINHLPGTGEDGRVSPEALFAWIGEVRKLCTEHDRAEIGDEIIGQILSRAPAGEDGVQPNLQVCEVMERIASKHIGIGFEVGTRNQRGACFRGEGSTQERELAAKYRSWANQRAFDYPYISSILESIAASYDHDAEFWDTQAEIESRLQH